jgi:hypothetical protein
MVITDTIYKKEKSSKCTASSVKQMFLFLAGMNEKYYNNTKQAKNFFASISKEASVNKMKAHISRIK